MNGTIDRSVVSAGTGHQAGSALAQINALGAMPIAALKARWRDLFGAEPPAFSRSYLESRLAYRVQELAYGGLRPATLGRLQAMGERLDGGKVARRSMRADDRPLPGTRLLREYQGVEHAVTVLTEGFEWEGRPYRSLSAIARAITGTRWNGPTFFGLRGPRGGA